MSAGRRRPGSRRDRGGAVLSGTIDAVWKRESARIIGGLTRMVHDVGLAEELAQDALVTALERWPSSGVPDNPGAWLMTIAKRRAVDHLRRADRLGRKHEQLARESSAELTPDSGDALRLVFLSCHPALPTAARIALTLRFVGGLTSGEVARAFLVTETVVSQRIAAAKRTLADEDARFEMPGDDELAERLSSVLEVVYLIFNEGYSATSGEDLMRPDLCLEAIRLARLLAELAPGEAEVHGLVALLEIQSSRAAARTGPSGEPVPLHDQNRGRWDQLLIRRGFTAMLRARAAGGPPGPYVLQAAIAVCHAQASSAEDTDWARIAGLYEALAVLRPTPVVRLNHAVAVGRAAGPRAGLDLTDPLLDEPALRDYHLLPSVRGDLLAKLGRAEEARREFERAAALTGNAAERAFLRRRASELAEVIAPVRTLGPAAEEFLAREDLDPATVRSYGQTLRRLRRSLGDRLPLESVTAAAVARVFRTAWGGAAAATWNRHRSAIRSFGAWASLGDLAVDLDRRTGNRTAAESIGPATLEALWNAPSLPLRERTFWVLLHESGASARAVLSLNVEDLDLDGREAHAGGDRVSWRAGTADLLPSLIAGRASGPVFLTDRRPGPARMPPRADLCPTTGRRRLSYERAEHLFKQATKPLDPSGAGFTLRGLRSRG
ncbi:RNA polymerase sigma factor [Amycolatopsis sp. CA-230715]|uniref:RNA polymerase sigma factor n=1 Tax=Amycolatopsis sp. CA-230715 TaxID=2745196 RepID=UPI001C32634B|nr:RNA polymerase sigma factor [Amycolatopsis sp. CA-230715]QWF77586.1 hypothetical protein HUW46_00978 [Amycolatopsis sp. CA-230715]